jgi:hypothetical protein
VLFYAAAVLLVLTGGFKVWRPEPTERVLAAVGVGRSSRAAARVLGAAEIVAGGVGLSSPHPVGGILVAATYGGFALFLVFLVAFRPSVRSCGCTGRQDTPPSLVHAGLDVGAASLGVMVASSSGVLGPAGFWRTFGLEGMVGLVVAAFLAYALSAAVTFLPQALRAPRPLPVAERHSGTERSRLVDDIFRQARIDADDPSMWGGIRARSGP